MNTMSDCNQGVLIYLVVCTLTGNMDIKQEKWQLADRQSKGILRLFANRSLPSRNGWHFQLGLSEGSEESQFPEPSSKVSPLFWGACLHRQTQSGHMKKTQVIHYIGHRCPIIISAVLTNLSPGSERPSSLPVTSNSQCLLYLCSFGPLFLPSFSPGQHQAKTFSMSFLFQVHICLMHFWVRIYLTAASDISLKLTAF